MKKILVLLTGLMCILSSFAQEKDNQQSQKNEIGLNLGSTTGLGFSYRHWFGKAGMQLTGIPIKTENTELYSFAITALYSFYEARYIRVFGFIGNHFMYDMEKGNDQPWKGMKPSLFNSDNNSDYDYFDEDSYFNKKTYSIGFGPGFAFGKTVRFNLMLGYGFYDILDSFEMYPTGEIGIYYRF